MTGNNEEKPVPNRVVRIGREVVKLEVETSPPRRIEVTGKTKRGDQFTRLLVVSEKGKINLV